MLTTDQRNEMRLCIVGPCSEAEKQEIREGLERIGEPMVSSIFWHPTGGPMIRFGVDRWMVVGNWNSPTITAADFIKTYLRP